MSIDFLTLPGPTLVEGIAFLLPGRRECIADLPEYAGEDPEWLHWMFMCDLHDECEVQS
jgi:hypothetical protein